MPRLRLPEVVIVPGIKEFSFIKLRSVCQRYEFEVNVWWWTIYLAI